MNIALEAYWTISNGLTYEQLRVSEKRRQCLQNFPNLAKDRNTDPRSSANPKQNKCEEHI